MKQILLYFIEDKVDLCMFILISTLNIIYIINNDITLLYGSIGFSWIWMIGAIIRMGIFRKQLTK